MLFEFTIYPDIFILFVGFLFLVVFTLIYLLDHKIRMIYQIKRNNTKKKPKEPDNPDEQNFNR